MRAKVIILKCEPDTFLHKSPYSPQIHLCYLPAIVSKWQAPPANYAPTTPLFATPIEKLVHTPTQQPRKSAQDTAVKSTEDNPPKTGQKWLSKSLSSKNTVNKV